MSSDTTPADDTPPFDSEALEAWVSETAERKGVSKQELLDEVLSSYWVLEELAGVIVETPADVLDSGGGRQEASPGAVPDGTDDSSDAADDVGASLENSELKEELQRIREAIDEVSSDQPARETSKRNEEVAKLRERVESLQSSVRSLRATVKNTPRQSGEAIEELRKRSVETAERIEHLDGEFDEATRSFDDRIQDTQQRQVELQGWIQSELDGIETVLEHLLESSEALNHRFDAATQSYRAELEALQTYRGEQEQLNELKREAIKVEVEAAHCEHCNMKIQLMLLDRPFCPGCDRPFSTVSPGGWLPFSSGTLHTDSPRDRDRGFPAESDGRVAERHEETTTRRFNDRGR